MYPWRIWRNKKKNIPGGKLITCDEDPARSFQAAVKLHDMNFWGVYFLSDPLSKLKETVETPASPEPTTDAPPSQGSNDPAPAPSTQPEQK